MKNVREFARYLAPVNPKLAALLVEAIARDEAASEQSANRAECDRVAKNMAALSGPEFDL